MLHMAAPKVAQIGLAPFLCGKRLDDNINLGWEQIKEGEGGATENKRSGLVENVLWSSVCAVLCTHLGEPWFDGGLHAAR